MPKQGQSVESCIVTEFKKKVGDKVAVGDILFSYETDKASFDEESKFEGTVLACFFNDNDEIPCLTNVMVIGEPGESFEEFAPGGSAPAAPAAPAGDPARGTAPSEVSSQAGISRPAGAGLRDSEVVEPERPQGVWGRPSPQFEGGVERSETVTGGASSSAGVSPRAKHLALEKGVDLNQVVGSGPGGRVIERDVIAAAASPRSGLAKVMMAQGGLQAPASGTGLAGMVKGSDLKTWKPSHTDIAGEGSEFTVEKMSNMRKLIASLRACTIPYRTLPSLPTCSALTPGRSRPFAKRPRKLTRKGRSTPMSLSTTSSATLSSRLLRSSLKSIRTAWEIPCACSILLISVAPLTRSAA